MTKKQTPAPKAKPAAKAESAAPVVETKTYADGTSATGTVPLPEQSPAEQQGAPVSVGLGEVVPERMLAALKEALERAGFTGVAIEQDGTAYAFRATSAEGNGIKGVGDWPVSDLEAFIAEAMKTASGPTVGDLIVNGAAERLAKVPEAPEVGGSVLFYPTVYETGQPPKIGTPELALIQHVWGPQCVNLDNGNSSVLVLVPQQDPVPYSCRLLSEQEAQELEAFAALPEAGTNAPIDQPSDAMLASALVVHRLEVARALPEVPIDAANVHPLTAGEGGGITRFKASEEDRRTMRVVIAGGVLSCQEVRE
jgi:hypothetical protein